jgi:hypothetical protein
MTPSTAPVANATAPSLPMMSNRSPRMTFSVSTFATAIAAAARASCASRTGPAAPPVRAATITDTATLAIIDAVFANSSRAAV